MQTSACGIHDKISTILNLVHAAPPAAMGRTRKSFSLFQSHSLRKNKPNADTFRETTLNSISFRETTLNSDSFRETTLNSDSFRETTLNSDSFRETTLNSVSFRETTLNSDSFRETTLNSVSFSVRREMAEGGAWLDQALFSFSRPLHSQSDNNSAFWSLRWNISLVIRTLCSACSAQPGLNPTAHLLGRTRESLPLSLLRSFRENET